MKRSLIDPAYRRTQSGHKNIDGVQFNSYSVGVLSYARISADGKIMVWSDNTRRDGADRYVVEVLDHGMVKNASGKTKRFHTEDAACRAGVELLRSL